MKYNITVKPTENPREWEVVEGFEYAGISIPEGFIFDGASIPLGLRWLFPHGGAKFPAAGMHDYLYRTAKMCKKDSDQIFLEIMLANKVPEWKAKSMYRAVKYFGQSSWYKRRKQNG